MGAVVPAPSDLPDRGIPRQCRGMGKALGEPCPLPIRDGSVSLPRNLSFASAAAAAQRSSPVVRCGPGWAKMQAARPRRATISVRRGSWRHFAPHCPGACIHSYRFQICLRCSDFLVHFAPFMGSAAAARGPVFQAWRDLREQPPSPSIICVRGREAAPPRPFGDRTVPNG